MDEKESTQSIVSRFIKKHKKAFVVLSRY